MELKVELMPFSHLFMTNLLFKVLFLYLWLLVSSCMDNQWKSGGLSRSSNGQL